MSTTDTHAYMVQYFTFIIKQVIYLGADFETVVWNAHFEGTGGLFYDYQPKQPILDLPPHAHFTGCEQLYELMFFSWASHFTAHT